MYCPSFDHCHCLIVTCQFAYRCTASTRLASADERTVRRIADAHLVGPPPYRYSVLYRYADTQYGTNWLGWAHSPLVTAAVVTLTDERTYDGWGAFWAIS